MGRLGEEVCVRWRPDGGKGVCGVDRWGEERCVGRAELGQIERCGEEGCEGGEHEGL